MSPIQSKLRGAPMASIPLLTLLALPLLLGLLALLQYRWTGELSQAERENARAGLQRSLEELALAFDTELARMMVIFHREAIRMQHAQALAARYAAWRSSALEPGLLRQLLIVTRDRREGLKLQSLDPSTGTFSEAEWPTELRPLEASLDTFLMHDPGGRRGRWQGARREGQRPFRGQEDSGARLFASAIPALVLPGAGSGLGQARRGSPRALILWLDLSVLRERWLPDLVADHLGSSEYNLYLSARSAPGDLLFRSGPTPQDRAPRSADAEVHLFGPLPPQEIRRLLRETEASENGARLDSRPPSTFHDRWLVHGVGSASLRGKGAWRLQAVHPRGSLDAMVATTRGRNLLVSMGILVLLAGAATLLAGAARRTQRLAAQQMEFVAGITHEILTPLAAVRSAGQNLADGVVADPEKVRRYGQLIDREGRRLSNMVSQVLEFAGMQARGQTLDLAPASLVTIIQSALASAHPSLQEAGIEVEADLPKDLPLISVDAEALGRALANLIANSVKYATEGKWLGISVVARSQDLRLIVEDRGPGIDSRDRAHIFEPFYRGRAVSASQIPGSGLGLSLVRNTIHEHGGSIDVERSEAGGSRFVILLPRNS